MGRIARQASPKAGPEILVLDRSAADFVDAATYAAAVALASARGELSLDMKDYSFVDITVEIITAGLATTMSVAVRSTSKTGADLTVETDWSRMNRTADIDKATGFDVPQALQEDIPMTATSLGRYTISLPVTNRFVSVVVWANTGGTGTRGRVYMSRRP